MSRMDTIAIRPAREGDAAGIAGLDVETWQAAYAGILSTPYLVGLSAERRARGWAQAIRHEPRDIRVAIDRGGIIRGFGSCGACRGDAEFAGEVFTLYVAPDWQNRGIGRRLLLSLFARLAEQGRNSAVIWVLRDNPARFFYRRLGGSEIRHKTLQVAGASVGAAGFAWRDLPGYLATSGNGEDRAGP